VSVNAKRQSYAPKNRANFYDILMPVKIAQRMLTGHFGLETLRIQDRNVPRHFGPRSDDRDPGPTTLRTLGTLRTSTLKEAGNDVVKGLKLEIRSVITVDDYCCLFDY